MKKVLVTGANGQLGHCIQKLAPIYKEISFTFKGSNHLDITNALEIEKLFANYKFNYCINCAAYTNVDQAEKTPDIAFKVNAEAVKNLALTCKQHGTTLIHLSTDYVFDGEKGAPYTVVDWPNPINQYGKSKWEGEKYVQNILNNYFIIRTSWLYHKKYGNNFYKKILEKAGKGEELRITDEQVGSPTNADNLAKFILEFIVTNNQSFGIYHFTDGQAMSWYGFALKIVAENGLKNTTIIVKDNNYRSFARRPRISVLN